MIYVSALLYLLAAFWGYKAWRTKDAVHRNFAIAFLIAALGTSLISYFAITTIRTL